MPRKPILFALTIVFGAALACLAGEITVRSFSLSKTLEMRTAAERVPAKIGGPIGARYQPSREWLGPYGARYRSNSLGYRDHDRAPAKPPGTRRIAVLGDSVAEGLGVDESQRFTTHLEAALNELGVGRHEVLNFALAGASTIDELEILKRDALRFLPDDVLVQVCANDVAENRRRESTSSPAEAPTPHRAGLRSLLRGHSGLYLFLAERYNGLRLRYGRSTRVLDEILALRQVDLEPTARHLEGIASASQAAGARAWVMYAPAEAEVRFRVDSPARHFHDLLESVLEPSGPRFVSVLEELRGAECDAFIDDVHFSPCGHKAVAAALADQLRVVDSR